MRRWTRRWLQKSARRSPAARCRRNCSTCTCGRSARKYACLLGLLTTEEGSADYFKRRLAEHEELVHITVEVNPLLPLAA